MNTVIAYVTRILHDLEYREELGRAGGNMIMRLFPDDIEVSELLRERCSTVKVLCNFLLAAGLPRDNEIFTYELRKLATDVGIALAFRCLEIFSEYETLCGKVDLPHFIQRKFDSSSQPLTQIRKSTLTKKSTNNKSRSGGLSKLVIGRTFLQCI